MFGLFIVIALTAGTVFNVLTIALPKIVDERLAENVPLLLVGSIATAVLVCGGLAQLCVGRLVERFRRTFCLPASPRSASPAICGRPMPTASP